MVSGVLFDRSENVADCKWFQLPPCLGFLGIAECGHLVASILPRSPGDVIIFINCAEEILSTFHPFQDLSLGECTSPIPALDDFLGCRVIDVCLSFVDCLFHCMKDLIV